MIGSRMVKILTDRGESVVIYDLKIDHEVLDYLLTSEVKEKLVLVEGDIRDYNHLLDVCKENNVEKIIHTASMMGNAQQPMLATNVNTGGMIAVLEVARVMNLKKLVYTSSNSVFSYDNEGLIKDDSKYCPDNNYGCTKAFNELSAEMYHKMYSLDITGIRIGSWIFGEFQRRGMTASVAVEAVYNPVKGIPGHVPYCDDNLAWLYCEDAALAHTMALDVKREEGMAGVYNVRGATCGIRELVDFVKKLVPDAQIDVAEEKTGQKYWNLDTSNIEKEVGFKCQWNIWDAWKKIIRQIREKEGLSVEFND